MIKGVRTLSGKKCPLLAVVDRASGFNPEGFLSTFFFSKVILGVRKSSLNINKLNRKLSSILYRSFS